MCGNDEVEKETANVVLIGSIALVAVPSESIHYLLKVIILYYFGPFLKIFFAYFQKAFKKAGAESVTNLLTYVSVKFGDLVHRQNFSMFLEIFGSALKAEQKREFDKLLELNKGLIKNDLYFLFVIRILTSFLKKSNIRTTI